MNGLTFWICGAVVWLCASASWLMTYRLHKQLLTLSQSVRELAEAMTKPYLRTGSRL